MELKAMMQEPVRSIDGKTITLSFKVDSEHQKECIAAYNRLKDKDALLKVVKYTSKRSLSANALLWLMLGQIAKKLNATSDEVYRQCIRDSSTYVTQYVNNKEVDRFMQIWSSRGDGWIVVPSGHVTESETELFCYYGTSAYNTSEMKHMIDLVISEAQALGIDTRSPDEIAATLAVWEANRK